MSHEVPNGPEQSASAFTVLARNDAGVIYERPMTSELFLGRKTFSSNAAKTVSEQPGYTASANCSGVVRRRGVTVVPPSDSHGANQLARMGTKKGSIK
jgi:hypothetical protein